MRPMTPRAESMSANPIPVPSAVMAVAVPWSWRKAIAKSTDAKVRSANPDKLSIRGVCTGLSIVKPLSAAMSRSTSSEAP